MATFFTKIANFLNDELVSIFFIAFFLSEYLKR